MPLAPVAELVRDDKGDLARVARAEERVPDDDAARTAEAGDVGVRLARAPARVRDENACDGDAGPLREATQIGGERLLAKRLEAVEERLQQDRRDEPEEQRQRRCGCRPGERPPGRQRAREADEPRHRRARQDEADGEPLRAIGRPTARGLGREAESPLVDVPAPERDRQPRDGQRGHRQRGDGDHCERPRQVRLRRPRRQGRKDREAESRVREQGRVDRPVVRTRPRHLVGGEEVEWARSVRHRSMSLRTV